MCDNPHSGRYLIFTPTAPKTNKTISYPLAQVTVQSSIFALARSPRYFHQPRHFRPERYLPASHPRYDKAFANDACKAYAAFSLGPRACTGRELAWTEARLLVAKLLWRFDVFKAPGETLDMAGLECQLLHYAFLAKPQVRVRFVPVQRKA
jgi:hypothetical protein